MISLTSLFSSTVPFHHDLLDKSLLLCLSFFLFLFVLNTFLFGCFFLQPHFLAIFSLGFSQLFHLSFNFLWGLFLWLLGFLLRFRFLDLLFLFLFTNRFFLLSASISSGTCVRL